MPCTSGPGGLSTDRDVIVYCIHGHRMSQSAAALLRSSGVAARYLVGGIDGFVEAGGPTFRAGKITSAGFRRAHPLGNAGKT